MERKKVLWYQLKIRNFLTTETEEVWTNTAILVSFPDLPFFVLWFVLSKIHRSRRAAKEGKAWEKLSHEYIRWMQGGHGGKVPHSRFLVDFIVDHSTARHAGTRSRMLSLTGKNHSQVYYRCIYSLALLCLLPVLLLKPYQRTFFSIMNLVAASPWSRNRTMIKATVYRPNMMPFL